MSTTVFTDVNTRVTGVSSSELVNEQVFGKKLGLMTRLFGCRHRNVGRPSSQGRVGYRACVGCGSRRQFDPETLATYGPFYAAPPGKL